MNSIGMPELIIVLVLAVYLVPVAAGIWALVTLHRIRVGQDAIRTSLEAIASAVRRA